MIQSANSLKRSNCDPEGDLQSSSSNRKMRELISNRALSRKFVNSLKSEQVVDQEAAKFGIGHPSIYNSLLGQLTGICLQINKSVLKKLRQDDFDMTRQLSLEGLIFLQIRSSNLFSMQLEKYGVPKCYHSAISEHLKDHFLSSVARRQSAYRPGFVYETFKRGAQSAEYISSNFSALRFSSEALQIFERLKLLHLCADTPALRLLLLDHKKETVGRLTKLLAMNEKELSEVSGSSYYYSNSLRSAPSLEALYLSPEFYLGQDPRIKALGYNLSKRSGLKQFRSAMREHLKQTIQEQLPELKAEYAVACLEQARNILAFRNETTKVFSETIKKGVSVSFSSLVNSVLPVKWF